MHSPRAISITCSYFLRLEVENSQRNAMEGRMTSIFATAKLETVEIRLQPSFFLTRPGTRENAAHVLCAILECMRRRLIGRASREGLF
jgi:hypothetical protein